MVHIVMMYPKNMQTFLAPRLILQEFIQLLENAGNQDIGSQDSWFGIEEWILIPNNTWRSIQSETCYVVWDTVAYRTDVETCLGCTFAMEVSGTINLEDTTCPEEIWITEYTSWQVDYGNCIGW